VGIQKISSLCLGVLLSLSLLAQRGGRPGAGGGFDTSNAPQGGSNRGVEYDTRDTFGVYYFSAEQPNLLRKLADTTLNRFDIYQPTNQTFVPYAHTGNIGSAHRPIWFDMPFRRGFDVGYHQYDLYYILPDQLRFSVLEKPFTRVFYSRGPTQQDGQFKGKFSRNFSNGLHFTVEGQTIREFGIDDQYPNQAGKVESAGTGMWWDAPNERYDAFLYFTSNTIEQQENGGIRIEPVAQNDAPLGNIDAQTATVFLGSNTDTRHANKTVGYRHYFSLIANDKNGTVTTTRDTITRAATSVQVRDTVQAAQNSMPRLKRDFTIAHKIEFQHHNYKYSDTDPDQIYSVDTIFPNSRPDYYGQFYVDPRGLRSAIRWRTLENDFQISTFRLSDEENDVEKEERNRLEIGLNHQLHWLREDQINTTFNNLFLTGKLDFTIKKAFQLRTYAHLGILSNAGDYRLSGDMKLDFGRFGRLDLSATSQASEPYRIQEQFYVSQRSLWRRDLQKVIHSQLRATYELPLLHLSASGGYHLVNNFIYYNTFGTPQQAENALNVLQLSIQQNSHFWKLHFYNQVTFQATSQSFYRTPSWLSHHRLYMETTLFRRAPLPFQLGVELRMNDTYQAEYYFPLLGQFQLQDTEEVNFYPLVNAFLNVKIKTARVFIKAENTINLLTPNRLYYQVANYAQPFFFLRAGFDWRFVN
jgi:hypothetical protein